MSNIFTTTLRLNLDNEEDRRAFDYLHSLDRRKYRSYSSAVVAAVNEAMRSAEADAQSNMNKLTGSLNLGGLGGLF